MVGGVGVDRVGEFMGAGGLGPSNAELNFSMSQISHCLGESTLATERQGDSVPDRTFWKDTCMLVRLILWAQNMHETCTMFTR